MKIFDDIETIVKDFPEIITPVDIILNELLLSIRRKKSFSLIRFGDGGLKIIHAIHHCLRRNLEIFLDKEGIPYDKLKDIITLWSRFANEANYIDCPDVYFRGNFWPRLKNNHKRITPATERKLKMWKQMYKEIGIVNTNYCNPEINYLSLIQREKCISIFDVMQKCKKICFITAIPEAAENLKLEGYNVTLLEIVKQYQHHYHTCFTSVVESIEETGNDYDLWLVSAGELGRLYTGLIKYQGGRAFDMGFVAELWAGEPLHPRLAPFLKKSEKNPLYLEFTENGLYYKDKI